MGLLITKKFHLFHLDEIELMWWLESLREIRANFRNSPIKVQIWGEGRLQKLTRICGADSYGECGGLLFSRGVWSGLVS